MPWLTFILLLSVLAQFVLTILVLLKLRSVRFAALADGRADKNLAKDDNRAWPPDVLRVAGAFDNQFQLPILFYVIVILALVTGPVSWVFTFLSWTFVISRYIHAYVLTGSNDFKWRFMSFAAGLGLLCALWIMLFLVLAIDTFIS